MVWQKFFKLFKCNLLHMWQERIYLRSMLVFETYNFSFFMKTMKLGASRSQLLTTMAQRMSMIGGYSVPVGLFAAASL